jgi:hypothetical protein
LRHLPPNPIFAPFDRKWHFTTPGGEVERRALITDGGVYDNLGIQVLEPGRDETKSVQLRTGSAFRFGNTKSGGWRYGTMKDWDVEVVDSPDAAAVAAYSSVAQHVYCVDLARTPWAQFYCHPAF